jgi:hypothetical protein
MSLGNYMRREPNANNKMKYFDIDLLSQNKIKMFSNMKTGIAHWYSARLRAG